MKRTLVAGAVGVGALLVSGLGPAPAAHAEERVCRGTIGQTTVDNVRVPAGAFCALNGTRVRGTVKVERGGRLSAYRAGIVGNVQAEGHSNVSVGWTVVGGSIQLKQGGGALLRYNAVKADIQLFTNRGSEGVYYNRVNGNLQCKSNIPAPHGRGNVVGGNKEDQCRRL